MRVYGLIRDCGDGSSSISWFLDDEIVEVLLEDEEYYMNEGSPSATLTLPEGVTPESIGIHISSWTRADVGLTDD